MNTCDPPPVDRQPTEASPSKLNKLSQVQDASESLSSSSDQRSPFLLRNDFLGTFCRRKNLICIFPCGRDKLTWVGAAEGEVFKGGAAGRQGSCPVGGKQKKGSISRFKMTRWRSKGSGRIRHKHTSKLANNFFKRVQEDPQFQCEF